MSVIAIAERSGFRAERGAVPLGAFLGAGALVLAAVASLIHMDAWGVPLCMFKATTGLPCMTCGGTRALVRLSHLDVGGALLMNPLVAFGFLVLVLWALADVLLVLRGRALVLDIGPGLSRTLRWMLVPVLLVNWAYVIWAGR